MAIDTDPEQIEQLRSQLDEANRQSHFVIFQSIEDNTDAVLRLITDYDSFRNIKEMHADRAEIRVVQDIVPITENLVKWAIAESNAARQGDQPEVLSDLEFYTNQVLLENNFPENPEDDD